MADLPANVTQSGSVSVPENDKEKVLLIKEICAKDCTMTEFQLLLHLANTYGLDPLSRQIWAVKYLGSPAHIFCGRDGLLVIAHRSGHFDGMESGVKTEENDELIGWAKVYRNDMTRPFIVEVFEKEYNTGRSVWKTKPRTMIQKVAEAQALRRAFSITGMYSPEEVDDSGRMPSLKVPESMESQSINDPNACSVCGGLVETNLQEKIQAETGGKPMCRNCFGKWWEDKKKVETPEGFTAEFKPAKPEKTKTKQTAPAAPEKPAEKKEEPVKTEAREAAPVAEPTPAKSPEKNKAAPKSEGRPEMSNRKCEGCGELISKTALETSKYILGPGRYICKNCMDKRTAEQKAEVEAKKAERKGDIIHDKKPQTAAPPAEDKQPAIPAEQKTPGSGIVCEDCGAEVPSNVASMAKMFAGKVLCQKCLAAYQKGGAV